MLRRSSDPTLLALLATTLVAWAAAPFLLHGWHTPVGPDAPVYLWWARIAGAEGLSAVGERVGEPALALALAGTLRLSPIAALTALEIAGTVAIGLAAAALVRAMDPEDRAAWFLSGLLAGTFASHLAAGYVANLLFAGMFVAAAVALAGATRRGAAAAALLLGAAGITHPLFLLLGAAIVAVASSLALRAERTRSIRELGAAIGGLALLGLAALALLVGPEPLHADTSRDALLRRAGLDGVLRGAYLERFLRRWPRYAPWGALPLAIAGFRRVRGFPRRFLAAWALAVAVGVVAALATRIVPPDRFLTFAFVVPILAGPGATRIARSARLPRVAAPALAGLLVVAMLVGAGAAWFRQEPFLSVRELTRLRTANAVAVAAPGATLLFPVASEESAFFATRAANVIRAAMPPARIRDVALEIAGTSAGAEATALRAATTQDAAAITARTDRSQRILVVPFAPRVSRGAPWETIATGVAVDPPLDASSFASTEEPLLPSSPIAMVLAGVGALLLFALLGVAGARAIGLDRIDAALVAPAFGAAAMVLAAVVVDRVGFRLVGWTAPLAASALAAALGFGARFLAEIDAGAEPRA